MQPAKEKKHLRSNVLNCLIAWENGMNLECAGINVNLDSRVNNAWKEVLDGINGSHNKAKSEYYGNN